MPPESKPVEADWPAAVTAWELLLGDERCVHDADRMGPVLANTLGLHRDVRCVLYPETVDEVQEIVRIAQQHRSPLNPVSTGKNWGLGSALPVRDGAALLVLTRMNRIREVNEQHGYAVIEPGVTQQQLAAFLAQHHPSLALNVTGSSEQTSIIGNALERGVGYMATRTDSLSGLEVVLGDGELLQTGFGHVPGSRMTHLYRYGHGPSLDGLFYQSNLGVITAAGFQLIHTPDCAQSILCRMSAADMLPAFVDAMRALYQAGLIHSVTHLANRARTRSTLEPLVAAELQLLFPEKTRPACLEEASLLLDQQGFGPWSAILPLQGDRRMVRRATRLIRKHLRPFCKVRVLSDGHLAFARRLLRPKSPRRALVNAIEPLFGFAANRPSSGALGSVYQPLGEIPDRALWEEVDSSHAGSLYCLPYIPVDGSFLAEQVAVIEERAGGFGFVPAVTANLVDGSAMELVISIAFDKRVPEQVEDAHNCVRELTDHFIRIGCPPYRVGIQSMDQVVDSESPYWQYVRRLKRVFDPGGIIAPGRYNID